MAVKNLESLVLRGVTVVVNGGTEAMRIRTSQDLGQTPASLSLSCNSTEPGNRLPKRHFHEAMDTAGKRAGRSGGSRGALRSRRADLPAASRGRLLASVISIAPQGSRQKPGVMPTVGNPQAYPAQFEPDAGAFTASTRGERNRWR